MRTVIALLAGLVLGGGPACRAAYLPVIGPGPLRFQPAPAPVVLPLPAAVPVEVSVAPGVSGVVQPGAGEVQDDLGASSNAVVTTVKSPALPGTGTETTGLDGLSMPVPPGTANELITPQMLLHFFHQRFDDTNGSGTGGVVVPLRFVPPQPGSRPPSKAVYTSP